MKAQANSKEFPGDSSSRGEIVKELNGKYFPTNAWWLFTDPSKQCKDYAVIKMAVFKGLNRDIFLTRKIAEGPINMQLEEALSFVLQYINLSSRFVGSQRIDYYELPVVSHKGDDSKRHMPQILYGSRPYYPFPF